MGVKFRPSFTDFANAEILPSRTFKQRRRRAIFGGVIFYILAFAVYLIVGLQPAPAVEAETGASTLTIPSISLTTPVSTVIKKDNILPVPSRIAGKYQENVNKVLLIGHSSTVFKDLKDVKLGDKVTLDYQTYTIQNIELVAKSDISMREILSKAPEKTIIIMTCAGEKLTATDYTHRLLVTATESQ